MPILEGDLEEVQQPESQLKNWVPEVFANIFNGGAAETKKASFAEEEEKPVQLKTKKLQPAP